MNSPVKKRYYLIPLLYLLITGSFFYLHFAPAPSVTVRSISAGPFRITAENPSDRGYGTFTIEYKDLGLDLGMQQGGGFTGIPLVCTEYSVTDKALTVTTTSGWELQFDFSAPQSGILFSVLRAAQPEGGAGAIARPSGEAGRATEASQGRTPFLPAVSGPELAAGERPVLTMYSVSGGRLSGGSPFPVVLTAPEEGTRAAVIIPPGTAFEENRLTFSSETLGVILTSQESATEKALYLSVLEQSLENYESPDIAGFRQRLYTKLREGLNGSGTPAWQTASGGTSFNPSAAAALLAEELQRGNLQNFRSLLSRLSASDRAAEAREMKLLPFLGKFGLRFGIPRSLGTSLSDHFSVSGNTVKYGTDYPDVASLIEGVLNGEVRVSREELQAFTDAVILPNLVFRDGTLRLTSPQAELQANSFILGIGRMMAQTESLPSSYNAIGSALTSSVLKTVTPEGFYPVSGTGSGTGGSDLAGIENLYPFVTENPNFPVWRDVGDGIFIYTAASDPEAIQSGNTASLELTYPTGISHHFAVLEVPGLTGVQMFGLQWPNDPEFEIYSSGWNFGSTREVFLAKFRHRSERETIRFSF